MNWTPLVWVALGAVLMAGMVHENAPDHFTGGEADRVAKERKQERLAELVALGRRGEGDPPGAAAAVVPDVRARPVRKVDRPGFSLLVCRGDATGKRLPRALVQRSGSQGALVEPFSCGYYATVQADNLDRPFDINSGMKLDLGSTAKLRTLAALPGRCRAHRTRLRPRAP